jgi:hypothetical protein
MPQFVGNFMKLLLAIYYRRSKIGYMEKGLVELSPENQNVYGNGLQKELSRSCTLTWRKAQYDSQAGV